MVVTWMRGKAAIEGAKKKTMKGMHEVWREVGQRGRNKRVREIERLRGGGRGESEKARGRLRRA